MVEVLKGGIKKVIMIAKIKLKDKKGQGIVSGLVGGMAGLIILVIVSLLIVDTLYDAGLLTSGGVSQTSVGAMRANYTKGIDNVSAKIPTILLIAAVVLLFGAIVILVQRSRQMTAGGGSI